ncbi:hypothetical protein [Streptomyces albidoflavus]|uniref:hypothetical protein n=1 Tax=Streptomyces albidoflavus TaxID=1886 RepID=UPI0022514AE2|nr:hypothetical protein [Streptomyces albidoflavus]MCX4444745.1 hypothetical protein [Streptomyces albidoflavus]
MVDMNAKAILANYLDDFPDETEMRGVPMHILVSIINNYISQYDNDHTEPVTALEALTATRLLAESMTASRGWITGEARREGATWTQVGHALGMTRQSAWEFFKAHAERPAAGFEHLAVSELAALGERPTDR